MNRASVKGWSWVSRIELGCSECSRSAVFRQAVVLAALCRQTFVKLVLHVFCSTNKGSHTHFNSRNGRHKKHWLSLVLVGLFCPATNGSLVLKPNGQLSLLTVGCEDPRGPTTTDVFFCLSFRLLSHLKVDAGDDETRMTTRG